MGNYKQHLSWVKTEIIAGESLIIIFLLWSIFDELSFRYILAVISCGIAALLVGNVFPDIDLNTSNVSTKLKYFFPVMHLNAWKQHTTHWGHWHSIIAGMTLSTLVGLLVKWVFGDDLLAIVIALMFCAGYINHLVCDQFYHELKGKHWKRKALKLW